jgi:CheY-like chemotaxis protein
MHDKKLLLMADDDLEDQEVFAKALSAAGVGHEVVFVDDGEALLDYLLCRGEYENNSEAQRPDLILLDLNMPRLDGHGALRELKKHEVLSDIPVIIFTTSTAARDVEETYRLGGQSYIEKPFSFKELVDRLKDIDRYWTRVSRIPTEKS